MADSSTPASTLQCEVCRGRGRRIPYGEPKRLVPDPAYPGRFDRSILDPEQIAASPECTACGGSGRKPSAQLTYDDRRTIRNLRPRGERAGSRNGIPSVRALADRYKVSEAAIRKVLRTFD